MVADKMEEKRMEETINLEQMFNVIKKRIVTILSLAFIGLGLAAILTFFVMTPKYSSSTQLLAKMAQNENNTVNVGDVNSNLMLINTYKDIIKSNLVIDESAEKLAEKGYVIEPDALRAMISVDQAQNSQMFTVSAENSDPKAAQAIADVITDTFKEKAKEVIDVDKITIIADAPLSEKPVSPNNKLFLFAGLILGSGFGVALAILRELMDKTVKDDSFISEELGITILGSVPEMTDEELSNVVPPRTTMSNKTQEPTSTDGEMRRTRSRV